jgi:hypothetical protein
MKPPQPEHNAVDVVLGPTLRDQMQLIDRFVFRLRSWEPRMQLAFTALPDCPEGGLRIVNCGPAWSDGDLAVLEKRVQGLARELRVTADLRRVSLPDAAIRPVWDVSWVDEQLRILDEDAAHARARIEQRLEDLSRLRARTSARIAGELGLYRFCWVDQGQEDAVVAAVDSPAVRELEYARREIPDFYGDAAAHQALVQCVVGSGLKLNASAAIEGDMNMLVWRCSLVDCRPIRGPGGCYAGEGLDLASALCAACVAYLDAL